MSRKRGKDHVANRQIATVRILQVDKGSQEQVASRQIATARISHITH
jgi:hypothetical protein